MRNSLSEQREWITEMYETEKAMKAIWKYKLTQMNNRIDMPKGAEVLTVQLQKGVLCIWALVDPEQEKEIRTIKVFGTGESISRADELFYIGTYLEFDGDLVWHVFQD